MILAIFFGAFAFLGIIRLNAFACFTAKENNKTGAVMLWIFALIIFLCFILAVIRL